MLKLLFLLIAASSLISCSARLVVKPAKSQLDPYPVALVPQAQTVQAVDTLATKQWSLKKIASEKIVSSPGSKKLTVALLGTGVDYNHEDLRSQIKVNQKEFKDIVVGRTKQENDVDEDKNGYVDDFIGYDFVEDDGLPFDRNGSGTGVAGVLAAVQNNGVGIKGVMKDVSLVPVRFIDESGFFLFPNLIKSLEYSLSENVDVILLQMPNYNLQAAPGDEAFAMEKVILTKILDKIKKKGIPIISSAGSSASDKMPRNSLIRVFAKYSNFVAVTASDKNDEKPFIANSGMEYVKTSAPGEDVLTTLPNNKYGEVSSSAVAAAHVAGAVGLAISHRHGQISTDKILKALLKAEASDVVKAFQFKAVGGNRLNVEKYLTYVKSI